MIPVLVFSLTLFLAVLLSDLAHRSVASTAVLFVLAGFLCGSGGLGFFDVQPDSPVLARLGEFALFAVLFTDGMEVGMKQLRYAWYLPGRALLFGLPLTLILTAILAHYIAGVPWVGALLVGAVLSPTDPVFAAAIVEQQRVPVRLRNLLNIESGLNDGLALPFVIGILAFAGEAGETVPVLIGEVVLGVALGVAAAWLASKVEQRTKLFSASAKYAPFFALSVGLTVFAVASLTHANEYLAAYFAGATLSTTHPEMQKEFKGFGSNLAELMKLAALLAFGALISPAFLNELPWTGYIFGALALLVVRPLALHLALWGADLGKRERVIAYWFGPKGFASVVYGIMVLESGMPDADRLFHLIAIVVFASIVAHSSTDVVMSAWFEPDKPKT